MDSINFSSFETLCTWRARFDVLLEELYIKRFSKKITFFARFYFIFGIFSSFHIYYSIKLFFIYKSYFALSIIQGELSILCRRLYFFYQSRTLETL